MLEIRILGCYEVTEKTKFGGTPSMCMERAHRLESLKKVKVEDKILLSFVPKRLIKEDTEKLKSLFSGKDVEIVLKYFIARAYDVQNKKFKDSRHIGIPYENESCPVQVDIDDLTARLEKRFHS